MADQGDAALAAKLRRLGALAGASGEARKRGDRIAEAVSLKAIR